MGGKAFEGVTRRVAKVEVGTTVTWLMNNWKDWKLNPDLNLHQSLLGSAGKNDSSGDIDINLNISAYDQAKVAQQMISLLGEDNVKPRPGNNQIFMAVPINGHPSQGLVQVDLMFGNYEWQKFSYFSPVATDNLLWGNHKASYFKGLYRTELLKAITAYSSDWVLVENDEVIARVGPTFFHDKGLVWRYRDRPLRKDGTARVKEFKEYTKDEFLAIYPSAITALADVMIDPKQACEFLLNVHPSHCETLESLSRCMYRYFDGPAHKTIVQIYLERLNNLKAEIPKDDFRAIYLRV